MSAEGQPSVARQTALWQLAPILGFGTKRPRVTPEDFADPLRLQARGHWFEPSCAHQPKQLPVTQRHQYDADLLPVLLKLLGGLAPTGQWPTQRRTNNHY
jgi:hypothetical protein